MAVQLKGSSLMEVIVCSLIMLIIFMLSMEIITKLSSRRDDHRAEMMALQTMKQLLDSELEAQIITYEWGEIEVVKEKLSPKLELMTLVATVKGKIFQLKKMKELL